MATKKKAKAKAKVTNPLQMLARRIYKTSGKSVRVLANATDMHFSTVARLVMGRRMPKIEQLQSLAKAAGGKLVIDYTPRAPRVAKTAKAA